MRYPIYLCGPINGRNDAGCIDWRETAKSLLVPLSTLDPMRLDYRGRELEEGIASQIVLNDKNDIRSCGALLVVGTSMEMFYAYELAIPVYVVNLSGEPLSPWLIYHSAKVFGTLREACEAILSDSIDYADY